MEIIPDLRQKHISGWTRGLRKHTPDDVEGFRRLPDSEFADVTVKSAIEAGWIVGVTDCSAAGDLTYIEADKLSEEIWARFKEASNIDPN